ncbi:MAG: hypothetical protein Q7J64_05065, partial [Elusimicrobiota bacterium]|nr:hypothetical protein [Elusimicrobiota bacterium]
MELPKLVAGDVLTLIPGTTDIGPPFEGGQKLVFPCRFKGAPYVAKFILLPKPAQTYERDDIVDEFRARAKREIEIMRSVDSPHFVKFGPTPLQIS